MDIDLPALLALLSDLTLRVTHTEQALAQANQENQRLMQQITDSEIPTPEPDPVDLHQDTAALYADVPSDVLLAQAEDDERDGRGEMAEVKRKVAKDRAKPPKAT